MTATSASVPFSSGPMPAPRLIETTSPSGPIRLKRAGGPGGIFLLDHESFDVLGRFEVDRGPQYLAYDFWWHLGYDVAVTSE